MSEPIKYGVVGALIVSGSVTGLMTVTRHLLVVDSVGLGELAKTSLPQGHSRIRSFLEQRQQLPPAAISRMARDLSKAVSPITDQLASTMEHAISARVGIAKAHQLADGVFLMAAFKGNTRSEEEKNVADAKVSRDFEKVASMLSEHHIRTWVTQEKYHHNTMPGDDSLDLDERPCLESFGLMCHRLALKASAENMVSQVTRIEEAVFNPRPVLPRF